MNKKEVITKVLNYYPQKIQNRIFSVANSKLKKDGIAEFSLPQLKTCPFAGSCKDDCYAGKGTYKFKTVKNRYELNFDITRSDNFINLVNESIRALPQIEFFRIHSSGDFYNKSYLYKWILIALQNRDRVFYAYTTSVRYLQGLEIPDNFVIIQSYGTKDKHLLNYSKSIAFIFENMQDLEEAVRTGNFVDAHKSDLEALKGAVLNKHIALLRH